MTTTLVLTLRLLMGVFNSEWSDRRGFGREQGGGAGWLELDGYRHEYL